MQCERCGANISEEEKYEHAGQTLCEDCYLDIKASPQVCDPWAVYTAKKETAGKVILTPVQEKIMGIIRDKGPVGMEDICKELGISEQEFRANFATLRHMELAKATKVGDEVKYMVFSG